MTWFTHPDVPGSLVEAQSDTHSEALESIGWEATEAPKPRTLADLIAERSTADRVRVEAAGGVFVTDDAPEPVAVAPKPARKTSKAAKAKTPTKD